VTMRAPSEMSRPAADAVGRARVAFAGEPGSFAEDAVLACFAPDAAVAVPTFRDVVDVVERGDATAGVLPIENVVFGTVRENYDLLAESSVRIVGEVIVPVRLCLAALAGQRIEDVERVYSHIQALGQAEAFLRTRSWSLLASTNTAGAGKMIRERGERGSAAVLSPRAAALMELEILAADIQTEPRNRTRFLVVAVPGASVPGFTDRGLHRAAGRRRSTLLVAVRNEPGSLHRVLGVLAAHGLNMSKLESRPSREHAWEYVFWVDLDADLCVPEAADALGALCEAAAEVRVMGCYAAAAEPEPEALEAAERPRPAG
jgi:prephenate dehydratase